MKQLPERFKHQPRTEQLQRYIDRKWKTNGFARTKPIEYNPESKDSNRYRWVENVSDGLRFVGTSHELIRLNHTGYFIDNFQDETVQGLVYQLPARDGQAQYVPAVSDPWNKDCSCVDFTSLTEDKEDAAHYADGMALRWAEREREDQAKESAKVRIEEIETEIKEAYKDFRRIAREIRSIGSGVQKIDVIRELVRKEWHRTKETIHKLRAERQRIQQYGIQY